MGKFQAACAEQLTVWVRYWAWLNTAPEDPKTHKRLPSRLDKYRRERKDSTFLPPMPEVEGHDQLLQYLWEVGPVMSSTEPVTQTEIRNWMANTGRVLNGWEAQVLRNLSIEYLGQVEASRSLTCPSPYAASPGYTRSEVAKKAARMFDSLIAAQAKKQKRIAK